MMYDDVLGEMGAAVGHEGKNEQLPVDAGRRGLVRKSLERR